MQQPKGGPAGLQTFQDFSMLSQQPFVPGLSHSDVTKMNFLFLPIVTAEQHSAHWMSSQELLCPCCCTDKLMCHKVL